LYELHIYIYKNKNEDWKNSPPRLLLRPGNFSNKWFCGTSTAIIVATFMFIIIIVFVITIIVIIAIMSSSAKTKHFVHVSFTN